MKKGYFLLFLGSSLVVHAAKMKSVIPPLPPTPTPLTIENADTAEFNTPLPDKPSATDTMRAPQSEPATNAMPSLEGLSIDQVHVILEPLLRAESEDQIVDALKNLSIEGTLSILPLIITSALPRNLKVQVILGVSLFFTNNKESQSRLFSLLKEHPTLYEGEPLLVVAAHSSYPQIISDVLAWNGAHPATLIDDAFQYALENNDLELLKTLTQKITTFDSSDATILLWGAISDRASAKIAQFLIEHGANLESEKDGKTVLLYAVEQLHKPIVTTILNAARQLPHIDITKMINKFVDPSIGTPLQMTLSIQQSQKHTAAEKQIAVEIEHLLRNAGATFTHNKH